MKADVAIIGGGASGIFAAIFAARGGAKTVILEKNPRIGKKILSTGNGRCNFTNSNIGVKNYNSDFVQCALEKFSSKDTVDFFEELGLLSKEEAEGRIYPLSGQATAVLDVLRFELERLGVRILSEFDAVDIDKIGDSFTIKSKKGDVCYAKSVIAAAGGMAAPKTGSDGSGYKLLKKNGHTVSKLVPALVQIKTTRGIQGVRAYGRVTLENGKSAVGEIQFTSSGLSGIPVFGLAKYARPGQSVYLDMLPDYTLDEVVCMLKKRPAQAMETYLIGVLNKALAQVLLKECNISPLSRKSNTLSDGEIRIIAEKIKGWKFEISGIMPWDNAQVTSGGIDLTLVNPETMESKIVKNLYIIGELLDIDGDCGGFNLQWAWSSGAVAGGEAAKCTELTE